MNTPTHVKLTSLTSVAMAAMLAFASAQGPAPSPSPAKHHARKARTTQSAEASSTPLPQAPQKQHARKARTTQAAEGSPTPFAQAPAKRHERKAGTAQATHASPTPLPQETPRRVRARKSSTVTGSASGENGLATPAPSPSRSWFSRVLSTPKPAPATAGPAGANPNQQVWVNTKTHVYHLPGSRFYGKTKEGKYMTEAEAIREGDRAAANKEKVASHTRRNRKTPVNVF